MGQFVGREYLFGAPTATTAAEVHPQQLHQKAAQTVGQTATNKHFNLRGSTGEDVDDLRAEGEKENAN